MLTSGMVPALYPDDEKEAIIGQVMNNSNTVISVVHTHTCIYIQRFEFCFDACIFKVFSCC